MRNGRRGRNSWTARWKHPSAPTPSTPTTVQRNGAGGHWKNSRTWATPKNPRCRNKTICTRERDCFQGDNPQLLQHIGRVGRVPPARGNHPSRSESRPIQMRVAHYTRRSSKCLIRIYTTHAGSPHTRRSSNIGSSQRVVIKGGPHTRG